MVARRFPWTTISVTAALSWRCKLPNVGFTSPQSLPLQLRPNKISFIAFNSTSLNSEQITNPISHEESSKQSPLKPGLYLVGTPIGNLEDITLRALRVLREAHVILSEDTRHSGRLMQHYNIKTPLLSYHKFNESQREQTVLRRLKQGEIIALISDAGTPGISDPGTELAKLCVDKNIPVIPIPGPSALVAALSASGLATNEFTFGRKCVIAREITKLHEEFWRGTLREAKEEFSSRQPKGEITLLIQGKEDQAIEAPSESDLEKDLQDLIYNGHTLSTAVKLVASETSVSRKTIYSIALKKFGKRHGLGII
ncbi:hypothetical protein FNV43_RR12484 [Rhamnella rubrinervis]|uniref:Tetrapyrrole methylase domain-containing protein n=1 Tax=Rhamnella rubrinervis TaxID=2594499 RepID=A0A8K0H7E6_9ROSA|nr:hypothetical protein FNV43_RR12484 [Rhamnella rubrinervis]